jgi:enediyne polyketide synthase
VRPSRLLLLGGDDAESLSRQLEELWESATRATSLSELAAAEPSANDPLRAALAAPDPEELAQRIEVLSSWLQEGPPQRLRAQRGIALGQRLESPRVGFLFPGQGAPVPKDPGFLADWMPDAAAVYEHAADLKAAGEVPAELVQLSVVTASVAGLRALRALGIEAAWALGHSVGEFTALHWAGALGEDEVLRIARRRGEVMTRHASAEGSMANIEADEQTFSAVVDGTDITVACVNSPRHRVISGTTDAVDAVVERAREQEGTRVVRLRVVGAFHSPLMRDTVPIFERELAEEEFGPPLRPVFSTVTGAEIKPEDDVRALLVRQMTEPVRFLDAAREAAGRADLLLEVGPGRMLSGLVSEFVEVPAVPLRIGHSSPQGLLTAVGAAHAVGVDVRADLLPNS